MYTSEMYQATNLIKLVKYDILNNDYKNSRIMSLTKHHISVGMLCI